MGWIIFFVWAVCANLWYALQGFPFNAIVLMPCGLSLAMRVWLEQERRDA